MATRVPTLSVDDQEYYPLHEEDDVPEVPTHRQQVTYVYDALRARFRDWFITSNVCIYWERGNTRDYRAPDLFVVKEPLMEPVTRVYQLWKQPLVAFVLEVGSRSTFREDEGPNVEIYQDRVRAAEYLYTDPPRGDKRLWRLGPSGYQPVDLEANGRLRSLELGLEFALEDGFLRVYTPDGEMLLTHEEQVLRLEDAEQQREAAEQQREEEVRRRQAAEAHAAALARQLAELRAQLADRDDSSA